MSRFVWRGSKASARQAPRSVRLQLEELEDRTVPAVFNVGAGDVATLIADINTANSNGQSNTINLTASTYDFTSANNNTFGANALPVITGNITINGNGAVLERDPSLGQNTPFRFFYVSGGQVASPSGSQSTGTATGSLTLEDLTLEGGLAQGGSSGTGGGGMGAGGAILNMGNLTVNGVTLVQNVAEGGSSGTGTSTSGGGLGGSGATTVGNFGVGGDGGVGGNGGVGGGGGAGSPPGTGGWGAGNGNGSIGGGGLGAGGAIFNMYGTATLTNSTLASNLAEGGQGASGGDGYGGAVFNVDGTLNVITSTLAHNSTVGATNGGGAIYNLDMGGANSTVNLTNSVLAGSVGSNDLINDQNNSTTGSAVVNAASPNIVMAMNTINGATTNGTPITANPQSNAAATNLSLTISTPATSSGSSVTLTATITPASGNPPSAGTVQFVDTTTNQTLGTATVVNGVATLTTTSVSSGDNITATYSGSSGAAGSNGSATVPAAATSSSSTSSSTTTVIVSPQNQAWLNAVYHALLGRDIDSTGLNEWGADLNNGTTPTQVVLDIEHTTEYQTDQVQAAFQKLLGVSAPQSAVTYLVDLMKGGADFRVIEAIIVGSPGFYAAAGGTNDAFLNAIYQDFLNRPVDPTSESAWSALMTAGYSPTQVALGVLTSKEYVTDMVTQDYMTYMGVAPDATSLGAYVSALMNGTMNNDMVVASLLGSQEWISQSATTSVPLG